MALTALAVAIATRSPLVKDGTASPIPVAPAAFPLSPYLEPAIPPVPVAATPAPAQILGTGGTPFTTFSGFDRPLIALKPPGAVGVATPYAPPPADTYAPMTPAPAQPSNPLPTGSRIVTVPPAVPSPRKATVAPGQVSVAPPGPVKGTVAGFDLAQVPLWGWLVGAVLVGALVFRR